MTQHATDTGPRTRVSSFNNSKLNSAHPHEHREHLRSYSPNIPASSEPEPEGDRVRYGLMPPTQASLPPTPQTHQDRDTETVKQRDAAACASTLTLPPPLSQLL